MKGRHLILIIGIALSAMACTEENAPPPAPATLGDEATGYYCGMTLVEHPGPKAQIFVEGREAPLWFSQARDGVVFQRSPEETAPVRAFYVTAWDDEAEGGAAAALKWVAAEDAFFVIESALRGGMGAAEAVPFSTLENAERYIGEAGGRIVRLNEIPDAYIVAPYSPAERAPAAAEEQEEESHAHQ